LDGTLQERSPCWLGLFAGHGAHGVGACHALRVEAEFRHPGQPGHHARTCPLNRQGKQKQHILTPVSAKATLAQRHAHHCSICGAARHTHMRACTHTHTRMRTRTHIQTQTRVCIHTGAHTHTYTCTCTRTNTQTHARTHTHTHTHMLCMHTLRV